MTDPRQASYAEHRRLYREANNLPGPMQGYGGKGGGATNKLLMTNPKGAK